jgi:hypothetical protein
MTIFQHRFCINILPNVVHYSSNASIVPSLETEANIAEHKTPTGSTQLMGGSSRGFDCRVSPQQLGVCIQRSAHSDDYISLGRQVKNYFQQSRLSSTHVLLGLAVSMLLGFFFMKKRYSLLQVVCLSVVLSFLSF